MTQKKDPSGSDTRSASSSAGQGPGEPAEEPLRREAEEVARQESGQSPEAVEDLSPEEVQHALHELRVHQIELEMQNDELRRVQEQLEASHARYFELYDLAPVGYLTLSEQGLIFEANLTAAMLFRTSRSALLKQPLSRFVLPEDQDIYYRHRKRLHETGEPQVCEIRMVREGGVPFWARVDSSAAQDAETGTRVSRATISDITEHKQAEDVRLENERKVLQTQRLESLGALAGGIAHDFNNMLTVIIGNCFLALEGLQDDSTGRPLVEAVVETAQRAAGVANQMLAYSGRGKFDVRLLDLSGLVLDMQDMLKACISKKAVLNLNLEKGAVPIEGDATQIRQVLMNLTTNASEAMGQSSGVISISAGTMNCTEQYLSKTISDQKAAEGRYAFLDVSDTGCGMDEETVRRLFEPYFTTKFAGRGLGMAAVLGIVRGHKGAMEVHSEAGKGTTVRVLFPLAKAEIEPTTGSEAKVGEAKDRTGGGCVLLVDDEEGVRTVGKRLLERIGLEVLIAADGCEALQVYQEHQDRIDLVVLDLTMPKMDGEETYRELRRIAPDVPIVLSSGYAEREVAARFAGQGLAGFVQKPYNPAMFMDRIHTLIRANATPG